MNRLMRAGGLAASVLILSIWCVTDASADPASPVPTADAEQPTTITLQVPSAADGTTTITVEVRPSGPVQATEIRVLGDADPHAPTQVRATVGNISLASITVDAQHPFIWTVPATPPSVGCGPHPTAEAPGCPQTTQVPVVPRPAAAATPSLPLRPLTPLTPPEVAGQQATPQVAPLATATPTTTGSGTSTDTGTSTETRTDTGTGTPARDTPTTPSARATVLPLASPPAPQAAASQPPNSRPSADPPAASASAASPPANSPPADNGPAGSAPAGGPLPPLVYTVQPGDTLRAIALHLYGDPAAYQRIATANLGRPMPDGRVFTDPSLIQPGWRLDIPQPTRVVDERADGRWYVVQPGDTLNGIAARFLGQPTRWPEVYALNRSAAGNPNLLRPGMQLHLPLSDRGAAPTAFSPTTELGGVGLWPS